MTPEQISFVKSILTVVIVSALSYLGEASNLQSVLNPYTATIVAGLAASLETLLKGKTGNALFGAVAVK